MAKIVWTAVAIEDLKAIHEYISRDSGFYADRFIDRIISRVEQVSDFPASGRIVPEFNKDTIRELIEGNYRIVYKINPDHIGIIRVHHASRLLK